MQNDKYHRDFSGEYTNEGRGEMKISIFLKEIAKNEKKNHDGN